jgi:pyruvate dehydrogenase E1 component alpha subunit
MNNVFVLNRDTALDFYHQMLLIRRFEEKCAEEYSAGRIRGFLHLYIGQEAVGTGIIKALTSDDAIFATYREHGHALLRGIDPGSIMSEMFGRLEGLCRGRGGSMHLFDRSRKFFGGNAIVAGALPVAVGYAIGQKMQGIKAITVCFFGEGAMAEGVFHESMNLAALWNAPILFVCENNLYAMGTALERSESQTDLCAKAESYKIRSSRVDGMDVASVYQAANLAIREINELSQPRFLECATYRFRAHSMFDPELYRDKSEVELWKKKDPIPRLAQQIEKEGFSSAKDLLLIGEEVSRQIDQAIAFAAKGTLEPISELTRFVYSDPPQATSGVEKHE